jgi:hypothetical protein
VSRRAALLFGIKTVHTAAFLAIGSALLLVFIDGLRARPARRTAVAGAIALTECAVYAGNGFTCPLTPVAVSLGDQTGSVSDIFLPDWFAARLPIISSSVLVAGLVLNARVMRRDRRAAAARLRVAA